MLLQEAELIVVSAELQGDKNIRARAKKAYLVLHKYSFSCDVGDEVWVHHPELLGGGWLRGEVTALTFTWVTVKFHGEALCLC